MTYLLVAKGIVVSSAKGGVLMFHFAVFLNIFVFWKSKLQTRSAKTLTVYYKAYFEEKSNHNTQVWFEVLGRLYADHN